MSFVIVDGIKCPVVHMPPEQYEQYMPTTPMRDYNIEYITLEHVTLNIRTPEDIFSELAEKLNLIDLRMEGMFYDGRVYIILIKLEDLPTTLKILLDNKFNYDIIREL